MDETSEGQIQADRDCSNRGHIDFVNFVDDEPLEFHGVISGSLFGSDVKWSGYKVGQKVEPQRRRREDYSEEQYEVERVSRWR